MTRASSIAGEYTDDAIERPANMIWQASLRPDQSFALRVQGLLSCDTAGHDCPMHWRQNGKRAGYTILTGKWSLKSKTLTLEAGTESIALALDATTESLKLTGPLTGALTTIALYSKAHDAKDDALAGKWLVANDPDAEGMQPTLTLPRYPVEGREHTVTIDAEKKSFVESLAGEAKAIEEGTFTIAGRPSGRGNGILVMRDGAHTDTAVIAKSTKDELDLEVLGGATLHLRRAP